MKKIIIFLTVICTVFYLCACGAGNTAGTTGDAAKAAGDTVGASGDTSKVSGDSGKLSVVTTIFPEYDWVNVILGDKGGDADVTLLIDGGVDLHSYQPSAEDILKISESDVFIYVGGESDGWVEEVLKSASNPNLISINLLEVLGDTVKEEEIVEGMEHDHEHEGEEAHEHDEAEEAHEHEEAGEAHEHEETEEAHEHEEETEHEHEEAEEGHGHEHEGEPEYDEHVWLSLKNASVLCEAISDALQKADPDNAETYKANVKAYQEELAELDEQYKAAVDAASLKTLIFGDRFPFRYMTDDYGLDYYAAFAGCSAESEASFETIIFLAGKVDETGVSSICTIENSDGKIAEAVKENTAKKDQKILVMDSMQSVTLKDFDAGETYLSAMEKNLEILKEALQ